MKTFWGILFAAILLTGPAIASDYLSIKGSDTMVHLASSWAENFMAANPDIDLSVTGGGSGTGIAALLNGTTDICMASRSIKAKEIKLAAKKGITANQIVVARDGIAVIVNPENHIDKLTTEQIGKIYAGQISNWNQVGGPDENIIILSRESSSGTYVFFQEHVLMKQDYTPRARLMPATSIIVQSVEADKWSIGYVGLGYAVEAGDKVKTLAVSDGGEFIIPSETTVKSGEYSISRPLYLYTNGEPTGKIKQFVDYCLSPEGQKIVRATGYITVTE